MSKCCLALLALVLTGPAWAAPIQSTTYTVQDANNPLAPVAPGWHTGQATYCGWTVGIQEGTAAPGASVSPTDQTFFVLFGGTSTFIGVVNNPFVAEGIAAACAHGHWVAWNVTNSVTGEFNIIYSYPF